MVRSQLRKEIFREIQRGADPVAGIASDRRALIAARGLARDEGKVHPKPNGGRPLEEAPRREPVLNKVPVAHAAVGESHRDGDDSPGGFGAMGGGWPGVPSGTLALSSRCMSAVNRATSLPSAIRRPE